MHTRCTFNSLRGRPGDPAPFLGHNGGEPNEHVISSSSENYSDGVPLGCPGSTAFENLLQAPTYPEKAKGL